MIICQLILTHRAIFCYLRVCKTQLTLPKIESVALSESGRMQELKARDYFCTGSKHSQKSWKIWLTIHNQTYIVRFQMVTLCIDVKN